MTGFIDQFPHVGRQIAAEAQPVVGDRMMESEHRSVERLAAKADPLEHGPELRRCPSIDWVPD